MRRLPPMLSVVLITVALSAVSAPALETHRPGNPDRRAAESLSLWDVLPDVWGALPRFWRDGGCRGDGCSDRTPAKQPPQKMKSGGEGCQVDPNGGHCGGG
jgi:hypothetical protein